MLARPKKLPEILAPVATREMCEAAIHNGADAVYMGMPHFNARGRTTDFTIEELRELIELCHASGVRVLLACNVLIFERELPALEALLREVLALGPDALIVQDIGLALLIKQLAPQQALHASTQMTVSCAEAIAITEDLNLKRYVLARELSLKEIQRVREKTDKELEVFVHGALCVSYSGQCLTSESQGGRSANRGQCAQSCRLPYGLLVDGKLQDLGERKHLVSPQDLCGLDNIPELLECGLESFKIEGRLKSAEYVAATVRSYREACLRHTQGPALSEVESRVHKDELQILFARGSFNGWLDGVNHQQLVDARFSGPTGLHLGTFQGQTADQWLELALAPQLDSQRLAHSTLKIGDGLAFIDQRQGLETGAVVVALRSSSGSGTVLVRLHDRAIAAQLRSGMQVYLNSSAQLEQELQSTYRDLQRHKKIVLSAMLVGSVGAVLTYEVQDADGHQVRVTSETPLALAHAAPLTKESAQRELGALGRSPFVLKNFIFNVAANCFIHTRELKHLRRAACEALLKARCSGQPSAFTEPAVLEEWRTRTYQQVPRTAAPQARLHILLREEAQVAALETLAPQARAGLGTVYLDFEYNKDYEHALQRVRALGLSCGIATTRILKPGELGHLSYMSRLKPDCILVRNLGALGVLRSSGIPLIGDFSLNAANALSAAWFFGKGLARLCPSYDLNRSQLLDLVQALPSAAFEITIHQYMPSFHMEHCVFAAFLSKGSSFRDCGRPCEKHRVELRAPDGSLHPLKADAECRNTMFSGKPQSAARLVPELLAAGVYQFRLEALFESAAELQKKIRTYLEVLENRVAPERALHELGIIESYGITEGQLFNQHVYQDKKKELVGIQRRRPAASTSLLD